MESQYFFGYWNVNFFSFAFFLHDYKEKQKMRRDKDDKANSTDHGKRRESQPR